MIGIIDYGLGNVQAFLNTFERIGKEARRVESDKTMRNCSHLILPGVGHFDHAMEKLNQSGLRAELEREVMIREKPLLGICVGMQMLSYKSDEGHLPGLGFIPGVVRSMSDGPKFDGLPLPHMGWNKVYPCSRSVLFPEGCAEPSYFYFLHSYYFEAEKREDVTAVTAYGQEFDATVSKGSIHGIQCHPEKSHHWGERLLSNFVGGDLC